MALIFLFKMFQLLFYYALHTESTTFFVQSTCVYEIPYSMVGMVMQQKEMKLFVSLICLEM